MPGVWKVHGVGIFNVRRDTAYSACRLNTAQSYLLLKKSPRSSTDSVSRGFLWPSFLLEHPRLRARLLALQIVGAIVYSSNSWAY
jgi:hypothetical protein